MMASSGAISLGLSTIVQPAASAGATFVTIWFSGQFHGVIKSDDADRLADDARAAALLLELEGLERLDGSLEMRPARPHLRVARELKRCAHFVGYDLGNFFGAFVVQRQDFLQQPKPIGLGGLRERRECSARRGDCAHSVGGRSHRDGGKGLFRSRIDDCFRGRLERLDPRAIDIESQLVVHPRMLLQIHVWMKFSSKNRSAGRKLQRLRLAPAWGWRRRRARVSRTVAHSWKPLSSAAYAVMASTPGSVPCAM
jgi:hypothetical protein